MPFHTVAYGDKNIRFKLQVSDRKTLGISVLPDLSIVVTAPASSLGEIETIKAKIKKRATWILRQQAGFRRFLPSQPPRRYLSGESHRYLGRQYRLKLETATAERVRLKDGHLRIELKNPLEPIAVQRLLADWYKQRARIVFTQKLEGCLDKFRKYEIPSPQLRLRKMHKRWGSCSRTGVITLNYDLVKTPSICIEYVIIHELCHLLHASHDRKFYGLLRRIMPDWEARKARLEQQET
jgi:predicted metal-dependent hydrolase